MEWTFFWGLSLWNCWSGKINAVVVEDREQCYYSILYYGEQLCANINTSEMEELKKNCHVEVENGT